MKRLLPFILLTALVFIAGCEEDKAYTGLAPTRLEKRASWSPDGSTIAYAGSGGIWLVDADGTNDRYLSPGFQADWSPDGKRLVIATLDWNIYLIDKDSTNFEWLIQDGLSNSPAWSPDGKWIAYCQPFVPGGLFWINIETQEGGGDSDVISGDWAPDSRHIVCYWKSGHGDQAIRSLNIHDSSFQTVAKLTTSNDGALTGIPRWSPDGEKIVFQMGSDIWVVDTSGQNLKRLARDALDPAWSPDGESIIYTKVKDGEYQLWVMNANGRKEHPLGE